MKVERGVSALVGALEAVISYLHMITMMTETVPNFRNDKAFI
jgi:hypothetical protein